MIREHGEIVVETSSESLPTRPEVLDAHLGVRGD